MVGRIIKINQSMVLSVIAPDDVPEAERIITVLAPDVEGYILGRSDTLSSYLPDIDFSAFDAKKRGISRRHAVLVSYNEIVHVMDLGSMNGTFINGTRMSAYEPHALRNGDRLGLGDLNIIITLAN